MFSIDEKACPLCGGTSIEVELGINYGFRTCTECKIGVAYNHSGLPLPDPDSGWLDWHDERNLRWALSAVNDNVLR
jgi:hypothetical protein